MRLTEQLTALGTTILIGAIGYVVAWLRNKIANRKIAKQSPLLDVINNFLSKDYLLPYIVLCVLSNVSNRKQENAWFRDFCPP